MLTKEQLSQDQADALSTMQHGATFLSGIAGTGKTTTALYHILNLVEQGVPASQILVLVPQKTLAKPYYELVDLFNLPPGSIPTIVTLSGLAQRMITLFWPLVNSLDLFAMPDSPPVFLTLETAQYYLAAVADPIMDGSGYFSSLHIQRNRLYSQILDNLNKATLVGFPLNTLGERLSAAWNGESGHTIIYQQAQEIVIQFRNYCYQHNLLDFSLQMDLFERHLAHQPVVQQYLQKSYSHLIYDNIEEDAPISHDLVETWLPKYENILLISDDNAGYRTFLGADPVSANRFVSHCTNTISFSNSFQSSKSVQNFSSSLSGCIFRNEPTIDDDIASTFQMEHLRLAPESSNAVVKEITALVESGVAPEQIAVLTPILNDTTRFTLADSLTKQGIPVRSHRPSRPLNTEPATTCLLTLARIAHPLWNMPINAYLLRNALMVAIDGMDLVRASILSETVLRKKQDSVELSSFDKITDAARLEQITYTYGGLYEKLRMWLENYEQFQPEPLDIFINRIFGELLSQPGFGMHNQFEHAAICARLVESIQKFRRVIVQAGTLNGKDVGQEYVEMVNRGILAAQYLDRPGLQNDNAVLLSPAYSFLMSNRKVEYQFWLDIGNITWSERLEQPLTHPYVLSRNWNQNEKWTHLNEIQVSQDTLSRLIMGLSARCKSKIFMLSSGISEQGQEQSSPFLKAVQRLLRSIYQQTRNDNV